ncbi:MAG: hypothetical protein J6Z14_00495 [Prevotella sp.]|nr:hypothetical protein [Prevotella sp.]
MWFLSSGVWQREREKWDGNPVPLKESPMEELEYVKQWYQRADPFRHLHLAGPQAGGYGSLSLVRPNWEFGSSKV